MTDLYTEIVLKLVLRNVRKTGSYKSLLSLSKFDALPADLQQSWWLLCKFAFEALERDQLVFSQDELEAFFPEGLALDKRILCFGLLQSAESIGFGISFHFLHLTFQEYLAALHLARQPPDKQLAVLRSHKPNDRFSPDRFTMVYRFFFGINRLLDLNTDTNILIQQIFECVAGETSDSFEKDFLSFCYCTFEAHNDLIGKKMAQCLVSQSTGINVDFGHPRTAHDCAVILHVIAKTQECDGMKMI